VLDLEPEEARRRLAHRTPSAEGGYDRMEAEPTDFFARVRQGYHDVAKAHPHRVKIIPAGGTIDETAAAIRKEVSIAFGLQ
jgi:dTMP kinase